MPAGRPIQAGSCRPGHQPPLEQEKNKGDRGLAWQATTRQWLILALRLSGDLDTAKEARDAASVGQSDNDQRERKSGTRSSWRPSPPSPSLYSWSAMRVWDLALDQVPMYRRLPLRRQALLR
jgi:hypothetical protein